MIKTILPKLQALYKYRTTIWAKSIIQRLDYLHFSATTIIRHTPHFALRIIVHTLLYKYTKSLLYFALWFALSQRIIFAQIEAGPTDQPQMPYYIYRLILLAALKLLGGEGLFIHLAPEVGDVGHNKWYNERYYGHSAKRKFARRAIGQC